MTTQTRPHRGSRPSMLLLMGVAGAGKTTIGKRLARTLGWTFRDADEFHPDVNIAKMKQGIPLTDADRWPWLEAIGYWLDTQRLHGGKSIVTCSALRRIYRDTLLNGRPDVKLVYLKGSKALIADRMSRRVNHFMPPSLLDSQFATLEEPTRDERALVVNVALTPSRIVSEVSSYVLPHAQRSTRAPKAPHR